MTVTAPTPPTGTQFVTAAEFAATVARFEAVNTRARTKGMDGSLSVERIGDARRGRVMEDGRPVTRWGYDVRVSGRVAINGWQPIAKAEALDGADDMIVTAFDRDDTTDYAAEFVKGHCGHCGTTRGNRRHHYLLRHTDTGQTTQVGRSCLRDFLGHEARATDLDFLIGYAKPKCSPPLFDVVAVAAGAIMVTGQYSPAASLTSTAVIVQRHLADVRVYPEDAAASAEFRAEFAGIADAAAEQAAAAIEWLTGTTETGYLGNLRALAQSGVVTERHYGLAVSLAQAYRRHLETADERREREQARAAREAERAARVAESRHLGAVGDKITVTGEVAVLRTIEGQYGRSRLVVIRTADGATVKAFTTAKWVWSLAEGEAVTVTGTVREHDEYNGEKTTVLTRPKRL